MILMKHCKWIDSGFGETSAQTTIWLMIIEIGIVFLYKSFVLVFFLF